MCVIPESAKHFESDDKGKEKTIGGPTVSPPALFPFLSLSQSVKKWTQNGGVSSEQHVYSGQNKIPRHAQTTKYKLSFNDSSRELNALVFVFKTDTVQYKNKS